ncbi:hypothetical protein F7725_018500 [Dissostichus mawsoni]|uniref:Helicase ATP-binding domain-containing protein n=1 Tax=Dissostichus mawsoni TaxID=36200 RepID=A0A7J5XSI3_DISMA|nr:hypothetical protein F7725_018500 [Dissostichus mawsoni]
MTAMMEIKRTQLNMTTPTAVVQPITIFKSFSGNPNRIESFRKKDRKIVFYWKTLLFYHLKCFHWTFSPTGCQKHHATLRSSQPALRQRCEKASVCSPGASPNFLTAEFKPLSPKLGLGNALEKVQRSLIAPALGKTEFDAQPKAAHPAPTLSRALARVLSVAENEAKHPTTHVPIHEKDQALRRLIYSKHNSPVEHPGSSSSLAGLQDYSAAVPSIPHEVVQLDPEEDVKPPPDLPILSTHSEHGLDGGQEPEAEQDLGSVHDYEASLSPVTSSVNITLSTSPIPLRCDLFPNDLYPHHEPDRFRSLHLAKEEHELVVANHKKLTSGSVGVSGAAGPDSGCSQDGVRYLSVMWCKASKKKHKRWEGDAVLITRGRTATLKDMEGKDIGKGSGYKVSTLASLSDGETLMIGGKEVEVMGIISAEDFARGRCFQEVQVEEPVSKTAPPPSRGSGAKAFCSPLLSGRADHQGPTQRRNKPANPAMTCWLQVCSALVMPRPSANHQWSNNKAGLPVVDVVIDPYLTTHLRPHQRDGLLFLYECVMGLRAVGRYGAILADEMGLGKTLQSVALAWTLLKQGPYGGKPVAKRVLVVTPGSLVNNWGAEFNKWLAESGSTFSLWIRIEKFVLSPLHSVLVISYEMLLRCLDQVQKVEFGLVICDEGHRLKNSSIKTSSAISSLSCSRRVILTGTPVQNDLQEFYAIIEFVNPGILGSSTGYRKVYEEPILRSRQPGCAEGFGEERAAELSRLTGMFILRRTQEIINCYLPPRLDWTLFCEPSPLQRDLYQQLLGHRVFKACLQGSTQTHTHLACITALKKLCNHPGLLHSTVKEKQESGSVENTLYDGLAELFPESYSSGGLNTADSGKLLVLSDLLSVIRQLNPTDRVVVVSNYTKTLDMLQDLCVHMSYTFCRLDGHTPTGQRQRLVDGFNSPYSLNFLFLLSSKAGGPWLGCGEMVRRRLCTFIVSSPQERIFQRQVAKQGLSGTVVDLGKRRSTPASPPLGRQGDRGGAPQKPLSMSELMQWRHFSGDTHTFSDPYLDLARKHITFAFQTTISHTAP